MPQENREQDSIAAFWLRGAAATLERAGLDVRALFAEAGPYLTALLDPDARFPSDKISLLWELAVTRSGNPAIALANWNAVRPAMFDVVGYAMMSSQNLLGLLKQIVRYLHIVADAGTLTLTENPEGHRLILEVFGRERPVPRQRYEFVS